ncbi:MAG TPA: alpha/beta hydrolase [Rhodobiaceae bacterium]|nr:alpha/beta hydrolase [Rhodobiaceae bacterium]
MHAHNGGQQSQLAQEEIINFQPQWFKNALLQKPVSRRVPFRNSDLHFLDWGSPNEAALPVVLVHGDGAHAHWFDFVAPLLSERHHVIALDLPGMGDSGWFDTYSRDIMADAIMEMIRAAGFTRRPGLIAHSFGGFISLLAAARHSTELAGLMICDFTVHPPAHHTEWYADVHEPRSTRIYETREAAIHRFRLMPEQPCANQFILDHIAAHSLRQTAEGGWTWKFDPSIYPGFVIGRDLPDLFAGLTCPLAVMFGANSHDFDNMTRREANAYMCGLNPKAAFFEVPDARHHIMLDQPHAFAAGVAAQIGRWQIEGYFNG